MSLTDPFVFKTLDISTSHITIEDVDKLNNANALHLAATYDLDGFGWLCYVGEFEENWQEMSPQFYKIMEEAKALDCDYVRFNRDGFEYKELEKYEW